MSVTKATQFCCLLSFWIRKMLPLCNFLNKAFSFPLELNYHFLFIVAKKKEEVAKKMFMIKKNLSSFEEMIRVVFLKILCGFWCSAGFMFQLTCDLNFWYQGIFSWNFKSFDWTKASKHHLLGCYWKLEVILFTFHIF